MSHIHITHIVICEIIPIRILCTPSINQTLKSFENLRRKKVFFFLRKEYIWLSMIYVYPSIICSSTIHFNNQYDLFCIQTWCKMLRNCKRVVLYALYYAICLFKERKCSTSFYVTHCDCYTLLSLTPFCWKKTLLSRSSHSQCI